MNRKRSLETLEVLNRKAADNAFTLEELDWSRPIDRGRYWSPEEIAPLFYLPAYASFLPEEKLRYNQLFAMGVCEQFIWLEEHILVNTLNKVLERNDAPPPLRRALEFFIEEEIKHTRMFRRVLERCEPEWYAGSASREFRLFNIASWQQFLLDRVLRNPRTFLVWVWTAIFFEERTVDYCRHYLKTAKADPSRLDPTFVMLHEYHFKDELRHYQLDQHLLAWIYDPQPGWKKTLGARMFGALMRGYVNPSRTSLRILEVMGREFPRLDAEVIPRLKLEIKDIGQSLEFHRMAFSREAVPKTMDLFAEYPELDPIWKLFLVESKAGSR